MNDNLNPADRGKKAAAERACEFVETGMRVGLGTGSTAAFMVRRLAERVSQEGLRITCVATSTRTSELAQSLGLTVVSLNDAKWLDLTIDGADEFDGDLNLIKGAGGALLREKIVATASDRMIVITDPTKDVDRLGAFPLPVEVIGFGWQSTQTLISELLASLDVQGREISIRQDGENQYVTDEGNLILDLHLKRIGNPRQLALILNQIPGVVENGLFTDICNEVVIGHEDGTAEVRTFDGPRATELPNPVRKPIRIASGVTQMTYDYDLFVIGGGSGGVRAARIAAGEAGAKVALAEDDRMGGTCVIRGCVPKKLMVFASGYKAQIDDARAYGWNIPKGETFDWPKMSERLNDELDRLEGVYRDMLDGSGVTVFNARARIAGPNEVELDTGERVTAKTILIATGGRPTLPDVPGGDHAIVSDDIFGLPELPKSILVVGGGYIACEFACILNGMGVKVAQFYRGAQILRGFDDESRGLIAEEMRHNGIDIHTGTNVLSIEPTANGLSVTATDGTNSDFDMVLYAIGRNPNTDDLGLEEVGVGIGRRGEIEVDKFSQTSVLSIYAIGDVTNRVNLTPVAIREGMAFVETVFKNNPTAVDHALIPSAVFTQPEYGSIGLTEEQAREAGPIEVYCASFLPMQTSFVERPDRAMMKLIVCATSRVIQGCHIVAPNAGEMIQLVGVAIKMGATKEDFDQTVAVHPTMSEELVTMRSPLRSA